MKKGIHPQVHPVVFVDGKYQIFSTSTKTSDQTIDIDGVKHHVIPVEVSSFTHPLYTGEKRFVDSQGQVGKFQEKMQRAEAFKKSLAEKKKTTEERKQQQSKSLRDLLGEV